MEKNSIAKIVVIGGSAGSLEIILSMVPKLKNDLKFPLVLVLHRKVSSDDILTDVIKLRTTLKVKEAEEKDILSPATIYICPSDYHLLFEKDKSISLDYSEKINFSRPSIDVTFQSAGDVFKENSVCILLSGGNNDGAKGLQFTKQHGGITVVQDPSDAEVSYMPKEAIAIMEPDYILKSSELPDFINSL